MKIEMNNRLISFAEQGKKYWIKRAIMPVIDAFISVVIFLSKKNIKRKKNYISICGIFKDEGPYLKEWIEYHLLIGVDKIYLYNNFSSDDYQSIIQPYIEDGKVELTDWPVPAGQISAYEDCYAKIRDKTDWICFLDIDEFICPKKELLISDWLHKFENKPSVVVYWKMFGTSGKIERPGNELLTESLTISWPDLYDVGKVFLNTKFEPVSIYHHELKSKIKIFGVNFSIPSINQFGKFIYFNINRKSFSGKIDIQINHYWSKSLLEYINKKSASGNVYDGGEIYDMNYFLRHENMNTSVDYSIFRFMIQLKNKMNL